MSALDFDREGQDATIAEAEASETFSHLRLCPRLRLTATEATEGALPSCVTSPQYS